jgi:hypothetical protein
MRWFWMTAGRFDRRIPLGPVGIDSFRFEKINFLKAIVKEGLNGFSISVAC